MKHVFVACALSLACFSAQAKDQLIPLSDADAAALQGKKIALTAHARPSFTAMTAGKASFGLFGAGAMIAEGNKLVDENGVVDPAQVVREQLAIALHDVFGAEMLPLDGTQTKAQKPKEIAALHPEADYVLDVRSGNWMYAYFPTKWATYWVGYSVQVQLVDTKTGRQVSNVACNANTHENPHPPSREQLHADGAKLLKDVTTGLGWVCVQVLAKEQFHLPPEKIATTPPQYVDPLAAISQGENGASTPASSTQPSQESTEAQTTGAGTK